MLRKTVSKNPGLLTIPPVNLDKRFRDVPVVMTCYVLRWDFNIPIDTLYTILRDHGTMLYFDTATDASAYFNKPHPAGEDYLYGIMESEKLGLESMYSLFPFKFVTEIFSGLRPPHRDKICVLQVPVCNIKPYLKHPDY